MNPAFTISPISRAASGASWAPRLRRIEGSISARPARITLPIDVQPCGCVSGAVSSMDDVFKALADAGRRKLLDVLHADNGQTLGSLCEHLDMTRQAVTKHLKLLEEANLVAPIWRGREKLHYLNPAPLHEIYERWSSKYDRQRLQALSDMKKHLENPK